MRRSCFMFLMVIFLASFGFVFGGWAMADDTMAKGESCHYCGMMKSKFGHTWMVIEYDGGSKTEVCSIHCGAIDLALNIDKAPVTITVGDYSTKNPINAEKAYWVLGGSKMGVMTTRAKWAFEEKSAADGFIQEFSGTPATFDEAVKAAFEDMYQDTQMIRKKRAMMRMKQGK
ncbi:MAG: nitrous oxide reductase accessory protein NosL [Deltaproteobacteria bacterium]|nr:nitrous oxide reductase accessory protein NosL [Deltaproteobacteria bacterium]